MERKLVENLTELGFEKRFIGGENVYVLRTPFIISVVNDDTIDVYCTEKNGDVYLYETSTLTEYAEDLQYDFDAVMETIKNSYLIEFETSDRKNIIRKIDATDLLKEVDKFIRDVVDISDYLVMYRQM